ncbi:MAG: hypothetical protein NVS3B21_26790 [Acidimicrobiales bacterium]
MDSERCAAVRTLAFAGRGLERAASPLTLPQYRVLAMVADAPERASRLAARVDVTKAALTGVLDALVAHGWLRRTGVAGDRRGVALELTTDGAAVLAGADETMGAWLDAVLGNVVGEPGLVIAAIAELGDAMRAHYRTMTR